MTRKNTLLTILFERPYLHLPPRDRLSVCSPLSPTVWYLFFPSFIVIGFFMSEGDNMGLYVADSPVLQSIRIPASYTSISTPSDDAATGAAKVQFICGRGLNGQDQWPIQISQGSILDPPGNWHVHWLYTLLVHREL